MDSFICNKALLTTVICQPKVSTAIMYHLRYNCFSLRVRIIPAEAGHLIQAFSSSGFISRFLRIRFAKQSHIQSETFGKVEDIMKRNIFVVYFLMGSSGRFDSNKDCLRTYLPKVAIFLWPVLAVQFTPKMRKFWEPEQFYHFKSKICHIITIHVLDIIKHAKIIVISEFYTKQGAFEHMKQKKVPPVKF